MTNPDDRLPNAIDAYETIADSYASEVETNPHSIYYERPAMRELLGDISSLRLLDAGCGPGIMMEWLVEKGAKSVVGVDGTSRMVEIARARLGEKCTLHVADLSQPMPFLKNESFDVIVSSATLGYIRDWKALFMEFSRILKGGGRVVFSVGHPCSEYTLDGTDDYFATELRDYVWKGFEKPIVVPNYRRPLSAMVNSIVEAGFTIDRILEPVPTPEFQKVNPDEYARLLRRPRVLCMRVCKSGNTE